MAELLHDGHGPADGRIEAQPGRYNADSRCIRWADDERNRFINAGLQKVERQCQPRYRCRLFICDMGYIEFFDLEDRHFSLSAATMLDRSRLLGDATLAVEAEEVRTTAAGSVSLLSRGGSCCSGVACGSRRCCCPTSLPATHCAWNRLDR